MIHPFNGKRLSDCKLSEPIAAIVVLPLNGMFPPLDLPGQVLPPHEMAALMVRPLQQVMLRPDKVSECGLIRLGETPGDEANCWIRQTNIEIVEVLGRGMAWLDTGTHESLLEASQFIATIEKRQGLKVAVPEEIAYRKGYIDAAALEQLAAPFKKNGYGQYLMQVLHDKVF